MPPISPAREVGVGVVGTGRMGAFHARTVAQVVHGARLVAVADPAPGTARALTDELGGTPYTDPADLLADPAVDAVVIAAPARLHTELVVAAAAAGKGVFVEKPMALTLADADRAVEAAAAAGVVLQVGFNRRFGDDFAAARAVVADGGVGTPQLLRSLTRDPGLANPAGVRPWTIYYETLIHDFDTLRWLNPGSEVVSVYADADALVAPDFRDAGLLDTSVVTLRFANGAFATAEASFSAAYGYDIRAEVFGSAGTVVADGSRVGAVHRTAAGASFSTPRSDQEMFAAAYAGELAVFVDSVRRGDATGSPAAGGADARAALAIALACIVSVQEGRRVDLAEVRA